MIIAGTVGRECKCCLIKFALRSKIAYDSGAYQENWSRDRAGKLTDCIDCKGVVLEWLRSEVEE